jgi:RimJ/RimL family protein N-acetyltransferase
MLDAEMTQPVDFHTEKFIYIKQIVVKRELQKAGIGTYLYKRFFNQYPGYIFYTHVSIFNQASMSLHRKTGFSKVGIFRKDFFNGEGNYQSDFLRRLHQEDVYNGSSRRIMPESLMCRTLYGLHVVEPEAERGA